MSVNYAVQGFIFKKEDSVEADRIFSVFTRDFGRIEVAGKAIRKITSKLRANMELFSFCDIEFIEGKHKKTLTDAVATKKFSHLFKQPEQFLVAGRISSLLEECIKGEEKDGRILHLISDVFEKLSSQDAASCSFVLYHYFFWNFISMLGYAPELSVCARCHQALAPEKLYMSHREGGVVCQNCKLRDDEAITSGAVKILRVMVKKDWNMLSKIKIDARIQRELEQVLQTYYSYRIEHGQY